MNQVVKRLLILALILGPMGGGCSEDSEPTGPTGVETPAEGAPDTMTERSRAPTDRESGMRSRAGRPAGRRAAAEESTLLQRLPDNVMFFVTTNGGDALKDNFERSIIGQIWGDPGTQNFYQSIKDVVVTSLEGQMPPEQAGMFQRVRRLAGPMLKRPIIFGAAEQEPAAEMPLYAFLLVDAGAGREEISPIVSELEAGFPEGSVVDHQVGSYTFHTWQQGMAGAYWGWADNYFVLAVGDMEGLAVKNLTQPAGAGGSSIMQAFQKVPAANDALALAVDFQKVASMVNTLLQENQAGAGQMTSVLEPLGLSRVQALVARLGISEAGMKTDVLLQAPQPYSGLLNCLKPVDPAQLDQVDASAVSAGVLNIDPTMLFDTIMNTLQTTFPPQAFEMTQQELAAFEAQMGFKIRDELLAGLAGPMVYYSLPPAVPPDLAANEQAAMMMGPAGSVPRLVLAAKLKDPALMQKSLAALVRFVEAAGAQSGVQFSTQQIEGQTVHALVYMPLAMMQITPCWTIIGDQLVFTTGAEDCAAVIKRLGAPAGSRKSIRSNADFQRVTANLPENLLSLSYTDSRSQFQQITTTLQQMWPMVVMTAQQQQINLPMEMPALDKYIEQMSSTYSYCWFDDVGIRSQAEGPGVALNAAAAAGGGALGTAIALPALFRARELAKRVQCQSNLAALGRTIKIYQMDHPDKLPASLEELIDTYLKPESLVCPSSGDEPGECSYVYRGADLKGPQIEDMILVHDKYENHKGQCRNVLFGDSSVKRMTEPEFQQAIAYDNQLRRQRGLPEKSADEGVATFRQEPTPVEAIPRLQQEADPARAESLQLECAGRLEAVGRAVLSYQKQFRGINPAFLPDLTVTVNLAPEDLICPAAGDQPGGCSYIYRGADLNSSAAAQMILAYDKRGVHGAVRNVLFADAAVKKLTEPQLQQAVAKDNELRRQKKLPEKPMEK